MESSGSRLNLIPRDFRLVHMMLIAGSGFLLYSALGIDDDHRVINGIANMFYLHRYVGLLWGAAVASYGVYALLRRRRTGILEPLSRPVAEQVREGFSVIGRYAFNRRISERVRSGMGRHNIMASYAFLGMLCGFLLLGIGGVGLILVTSDSGIYSIFLGIHILGAGFLSLFVLAHLFAVFNKANRPLLFAVFSHGRVPKDWAEESMPGYFAGKVITGRDRKGK